MAPPPAAMPTLTDVCAEIPLVLIGAPAQASVSAVTSDHYSGAAAATRHLLELGHRSVVHIAASADRAGTGSRLAGWRDTLRAAGVDIRAPVAGDGTAETGYALGRRLAARPEVTAIFVADDQMAVGVLRALSEARRRVPADVSLVGFGGMPEGEFFSPPLTTVAEDFAELGRRGVELLEAAIAGGDAVPVHETLPTALIVRASTAPVA